MVGKADGLPGVPVGPGVVGLGLLLVALANPTTSLGPSVIGATVAVFVAVGIGLAIVALADPTDSSGPAGCSHSS